MEEIMENIGYSILLIIVGLFLGALLILLMNKLRILNSSKEADKLIEKATKEAEKLKKQMVISVKGDRGDCYDLITDTGVKRIKLQEANNVAIDRVHEIGRAINQCIQNFSDEFILFLPTYLTGEALTKLKGGKDYLSKCIARNIVVGAPDVPGRDKPEYSVPLGLLSYALKGRA